MAEEFPARMIHATPGERQQFIRNHTQVLPVPHAPEIQLHLADDSTDLWLKTEDELEQIGLPPPYWAFAWAGGQALARYIIDNPDLVRGKTVLDFASGSGIAGIAAAKAGAARIEATDIDAYAIAAMQLNASINGVTLHAHQGDLTGTRGEWDVILAGDISYEKDMAAAVTSWLGDLHGQGIKVLIGDPGRSYLARDKLAAIASYEVPVMRDLEDALVKHTSVWTFIAPQETGLPSQD